MSRSPSRLPQRVTVQSDEDFVVFIIGMRIHRLWRFWRWLPAMSAMPKMQAELAADPDTGYLGGDTWFGRTTVTIQYWRSVDDLLRYAHDAESAHLPAWRYFNRKVAQNDDVGIFHETYPIDRNAFEVIYVNMPAHGLGKVKPVVPAHGRMQSARNRLQGSSSIPVPNGETY